MKNLASQASENKQRRWAASVLLKRTAALHPALHALQAQQTPSATSLPSAPAAAPMVKTVNKELTQEQAVRMALKKVLSAMMGAPCTNAPQSYLIRIHSKEEKSCIVTVDRLTETIEKAIVPRLTSRQSVTMALRKAPCWAMAEASGLYEAEQLSHTLSEQPGNVIAEALIRDKTSKLVKAFKGKDSRG